MYISDDLYNEYAEGARKSGGTPLTPDELHQFMDPLDPQRQRHWEQKFGGGQPHGLTKEFIDNIGNATISPQTVERMHRRHSGGGNDSPRR